MRTPSSASDRRPVSASASTSPASLRSVSRIARWRISSSATTVTACWRISRSKSPSPPESRAATSQACGAPRPRVDTGSTRARPASSGWAGANSPASDPRPAAALRRRTSSATCSSAPSGQLAPEQLRGDRLPAPGEHGHGAAGRRGERAHDLVEPALLEHDPLEPLVDRDPALEHLVLLVDEPRERLLGDRDERQLVGDLEDGEAGGLRLLDDRLRHVLVVEAGPEAEPGEMAVGQQPDELALARLVVELDARRQQQLTARQPRRRVRQLRYVHPPNRRIGTVLAGRELQAHLGDEAAYGEHQWRTIRSQASVRTERSTLSISSNSSVSAISGGDSWITGSPRSSARQISPRL